jgi:hypothetical protein
MSVVRPEFGPTLPELVGPRIRALGRRGRIALWVAVAALAGAIAAWALASGSGRTEVLVREPVAFTMVHGPGLAEARPRRGEVLRLQTPSRAGPAQSFAVTPLRLGHYRGDPTAVLTGMSPLLVERMRARLPGFVWRGDGRVNINKQPGYAILYQYRAPRGTVYGHRVLLLPGGDQPPREGVDISMLAERSAAVSRVAAVGANGELKTALRSFRFGTERP